MSCADVSYAYTVKNDFMLRPLEIGQYAEYRIISLNEASCGNGCKISVYDKEIIDDKECFWIRLDIFDNKKREMSLKALVEQLDADDFSKRPDYYISQGIAVLFEQAHKLIVTLDEGHSYSVDANKFFSQKNILAATFYNDLPDEKGWVDYSKMELIKRTEDILVPAGSFSCDHFQVKTNCKDVYADEGLDLWRCVQVPFLGIVKLEFSKTEYAGKRRYKQLKLDKTQKWWEKFLHHFLKEQMSYRQREDDFCLVLINYN